MSTQYSGLAANISPPAAQSILSSTNASPIVLAFSAAHGMATGDTVHVSGHLVNTAANGEWVITVVDSTHLSLNTSTGNGVGAATGTAQDLTPGASFPVPSDGDDADAASISTSGPGEPLGDRTAFLAKNLGGYKLVQTIENFLDGGASFSSDSPWQSLTPPGTSAYSFTGGTIIWTIPGLTLDDMLEIDVSLNARVSAGTAQLAIYYKFDADGATPATVSRLAGSGQQIAAAATFVSGMNLYGVQGPSAGFGTGLSGGSCFLAVWASISSGGATVDMIGDLFMSCKVWRKTHMPQ